MKKILIFLVLFSFTVTNANESVIGDSTANVDEVELKAVAKTWSKPLVEKMVEDKFFRNEVLFQYLMNKKLAIKFDNEMNNLDNSSQWALKLALQEAKYKIYLNNYVDSLNYPDFKELSKELYKVEPKRYAEKVEQRVVSHIYFQCLAEICEEKELKANKVEKELKAGEDFYSLVKSSTEDDLTRDSKGRLTNAVSKDDSDIDSTFKAALFELDKTGDTSGVIKTQYGYHIIKLEEIVPASIKKYEEVEANMVSSLKAMYKKLSLDVLRSEVMSVDEVKVDEKKLSGILKELVE